MSLLRAANLRFYQRHPWQLLLTLIGIALGVAIVTGIDLSLDSAQRAFRLSMEAVAGKTTHHIVAGAGLLDESLYVELRVRHGVRDIAPVVEGYVESQGQPLHVLGVDPLAVVEAGRQRNIGPAADKALTRLLGEPDTVLIGKRGGLKLGVKPGGTLVLGHDQDTRPVTVLGYLEGGDPPEAALEGLLVADIATAQELLGRVGRLDRIDAQLPDQPQELDRLRGLLPPGVLLEEAEGRNTAALRMTEAFTLNLKALSLLALLVGMFIIYNTLTFSVLQRRPLLATLRVLGVTRRQVLTGILGEAALLGAVGTGLGLAAGVLAAQGLLRLVTRTLSDVYFVSTVTELFYDPWLLVKGLLLGIGAALIASLAPAIEAAFSPPSLAQRRSLLEGRFRRLLPGLAGLGLGLLAVGYLLLSRADTGLGVALAGQFLQMLGYGLITPALLALLIDGAGRLPLPTLPRLALRGLRGGLSRTGVAMAALALSVAAGIGVGVMVHSFRVAVGDWLEQILQADLYVSLPSTPGRSSEVLPPDLASVLSRLPGVERTSTGRRVWIETGFGRDEFMVLNPAYEDRPGFRFRGGEGADIWRGFQHRDEVLISEPYANHHHIGPGDTLTLATADGPRSFPVGGVFFDYRSDRGIVLMHRRLFDRLWHDPGISSLGLYLAPGADLAAVQAAAERLTTARNQGVLIRSNREIRQASLEVFDRTFVITRVLGVLALGVAFVGILSALLALSIERARELAILRATGLTPRETVVLVLIQTGLLGLCAGLLAWPLGTGIAVALVKVINLRSFGWTMDLALPASAYGEALALAVVAALLAGLYPAWRAGRVPPALALRED
ncbi:FtsX-like permease family protein [Methylomagnum sp.]